MKTVVITGSASGLWFEMAKQFRKNNYNVVISDVLEEKLKEANGKLKEIESEGKISDVICDVTSEKDLQNLKEFKIVDIWINNAGVNQNMIPIWKLIQNK